MRISTTTLGNQPTFVFEIAPKSNKSHIADSQHNITATITPSQAYRRSYLHPTGFNMMFQSRLITKVNTFTKTTAEDSLIFFSLKTEISG